MSISCVPFILSGSCGQRELVETQQALKEKLIAFKYVPLLQDSLMKTMGGWSRDAYQAYIHTPLPLLDDGSPQIKFLVFVFRWLQYFPNSIYYVIHFHNNIIKWIFSGIYYSIMSFALYPSFDNTCI